MLLARTTNNPNDVNSIDFSSQLSPAQWEAVRYLDGPSLVIASAGSGKTRMLTYKVAYLIQSGLKPWNILALTFTNKAAREMRERIDTLIGSGSTQSLWAGTFHSIFARILRREAERIGFSPNYTIYDTDDQKALIKQLVKARGLDDKVYKPSTIAARISDAKNRLLLPEAYQSDPERYQRDKANNIAQCGSIYAEYQRVLKQSDAMDFDDLLVNTFLLFRNNEDVRQRYKERFGYILVDEYQDTNYAQHRIVTLLADEPDSRICVVGDDAQSIYSFRGANIDNILNFNKQYPNARLFKLERNYRSTQNIVSAADSVIRRNKHQIAKTVFSEEAQGDLLRVIAAASDKDEAAIIAKTIRGLHHKEHEPWDSFAILYRTNAQSRAFEEAFNERGIPYRVYGSLSFYQRKEIKDFIAYMRLLINPNDDIALRRIVNVPARGIGQTTVNRLVATAATEGITLWQAINRLPQLHTDISAAAAKRLTAFVALMEQMQERVSSVSALPLAISILGESGLQAEMLKDTSVEGMARRENIDSLLGAIGEFEADFKNQHGEDAVAPLGEYIANVSLLTDADQKDDGSPRVTVMTIHAAKGLEFDNVFITGLEDTLFPASSAFLDWREMEEERRLFYVAITRAAHRLFLTHAARRFRYGKMEFCQPSQFFSEIDKQYLTGDVAGKKVSSPTPLFGGSKELFNKTSTHTSTERPIGQSVWGNRAASPLKPMPRQAMPAKSISTAAIPGGTLQVGTRVYHERFGNGTIEELTNQDGTQKARIAFDEAGTKNLLLRFAKLTIIN